MRTIHTAWNWLNTAWCSLAHPEPLWPIHGEYRCRTCLRVHRVEWANHAVTVKP